MTHAWKEGPKPAPEELMAFADGELEGGRREQVELAQLAKGDRHAQEGQAADRHGHRHALQHAATYHPAAHRDIVEGKSERAEGGVKDTEQETLPPSTAPHGGMRHS